MPRDIGTSTGVKQTVIGVARDERQLLLELRHVAVRAADLVRPNALRSPPGSETPGAGERPPPLTPVFESMMIGDGSISLLLSSGASGNSDVVTWQPGAAIKRAPASSARCSSGWPYTALLKQLRRWVLAVRLLVDGGVFEPKVRRQVDDLHARVVQRLAGARAGGVRQAQERDVDALGQAPAPARARRPRAPNQKGRQHRARPGGPRSGVCQPSRARPP